jgi:hypothetical protein
MGQALGDAPSMTLASSTENLSPSSVNSTCALFAKATQRRRVNSWRAELDTAVRMGGSSCMVGIVDGVRREQGGRENGGWKCYCIPIDYNAGQDIKELNVDADSADHVHCTEPGAVSTRLCNSSGVRTQMLSKPGRRRGVR